MMANATGYGQTLQVMAVAWVCNWRVSTPDVLNSFFSNGQSHPSEFVWLYDTHHHGEKSLHTDTMQKREAGVIARIDTPIATQL